MNKWTPYYVLILSILQKMGTKMAVEATLLTEEKQCASFHVTQHTAAMMSMEPGTEPFKHQPVQAECYLICHMLLGAGKHGD